MIDYCYLTIKAGDQLTENGDNVGMKDGYMIDTINPNEYPFTDDDFGGEHLTAFPVFKIELNKLDVIKPLLKEEIPTTSPLINGQYSPLYRERIGRFDLIDLANLVGFPGLVDQWRGPNPVGVIDLRGFDWVSKVRYTKDIDFSTYVQDNNLTTGGLKTVGSGGDFATYTALEADLGTLLSNLIGRLISNVSESASVLFNTDMDIFDVILDSDDNHLGDVTAGWTLTVTHDSHAIQFAPTTDGTAFIMKDFSILRTTAAVVDFLYLTQIVMTSFGDTQNVNNMFFDGGGLTGGGINSKGEKIEINSIAIRDCAGDGFHKDTGDGADYIIESSLVEGCTVGLALESRNVTVRNVACYNNPTKNFENISAATGIETGDNGTSNADVNWNVGTDNHSSLTPGSEIELNDAIPSYAAHLLGGTTSSTSPTISTDDMSGNPQNPEWLIGPKNIVTVGGVGKLVDGGLIENGLVGGRLVC